MRILIVDDEPAVRFSLTELLEAEGHDVRAAEHAPAALALAPPWVEDPVFEGPIRSHVTPRRRSCSTHSCRLPSTCDSTLAIRGIWASTCSSARALTSADCLGSSWVRTTSAAPAPTAARPRAGTWLGGPARGRGTGEQADGRSFLGGMLTQEPDRVTEARQRLARLQATQRR